MVQAEEIEVPITVDKQQFEQALRAAERESKQASERMEEDQEEAGDSRGAFLGGAVGGAIGGAVGAAVAHTPLGNIVGSFGQIFGAMLTIILLPILIPAMKAVTKHLPSILEWSRKAANFIENDVVPPLKRMADVLAGPKENVPDPLTEQVGPGEALGTVLRFGKEALFDPGGTAATIARGARRIGREGGPGQQLFGGFGAVAALGPTGGALQVQGNIDRLIADPDHPYDRSGVDSRRHGTGVP